MTDTLLETWNGWTIRFRPGTQQPGRLLLLLHGWTGDENSMWVFARNFPPHLWLLAPRGLYPAEQGGYSWRPVSPTTFGRPTLDDLRPAAEALVDLVDAFGAHHDLDVRQFEVMGFSQGAALSVVMACLYPQRVWRAAILAGFVPDGMHDLLASRPLQGKSLFLAHGTQDRLVPIERARTSRNLLEQAGAQVLYCEDEVGHKVSAGCLQALEAFFAGDDVGFSGDWKSNPSSGF